MRVSIPCVFISLLSLVQSFHPSHIDGDADLQCLACNASYYFIGGERFDCPANSSVVVAFADIISECV